MKTVLALVISILISIPSYSQIRPIDKKNIKTQLLKKINQLRKSKGAAPLKFDEKLSKPAEVQSFYMSKNNKLTHGQANPRFNTPAKRIKHFSPLLFDIFGENVLLSKKVRFPLSSAACIRIANEMFEAWKNSPGHYANMIDKEFDSTNFAFALNADNQIYATNVFARRGIKIKGQLSNNQFGLKEDVGGNCFDYQNFYSNILINVGNAVEMQGNDVVLYYHDKELFFRMFSGKNDGIAIDIMEVEQFSCGKPNHLDLSPIHDGVLLKPVYRDELGKNNQAKSDYRIIAKVGAIPAHLVGKELTFAVLLIKDGIVCKRVIPGNVPHATYPLKKLEVNLENPDNVVGAGNNSIKTISFPFHFQANQTTPLKFPKVSIDAKKVLLVEVKSYSSIEGEQSRNERLHSERAKVIQNHILRSLKKKPAKIELTTKENWEEFYFQLKYHFADSLLDKSEAELREMASNKLLEELPWESMLFDQRKSIATIYYIPENEPIEKVTDTGFNNLNFAIINKDNELAKKALYEIYNSERITAEHLFDESTFEAITGEKELVENTAAVLSRIYKSDLRKSIKFINKWLTSADQLKPEAKFNLLNLYAMINNDLLNVWDLPSKRLANVINPRYVNEVSRIFSSDDLMLNLHLTFIKYYGQVNDSKNIGKSFDFIAGYFGKRALNAEDAIALSKFYNHWSMYQLTNDYLIGKLGDGTLNEDAVFLLMKTLSHTNEERYQADFEKIYAKSFELNKLRWCDWVEGTPQLKRDRKLKKLYCENCL